MDYGIKLMKKMNNKYRNNNNQIYSLNYKFDSTSIAGKISGTALDLIKKYNELAKEAHGNGNYVEMEVFRSLHTLREVYIQFICFENTPKHIISPSNYTLL